MAKKKNLQVIEQKEVYFYDDELTAVRAEDGQIYVSIRHMCDALGIDPQGQTRRIQRQQILEDGYTWVDILSTQPNPQRRSTQVLRVDLVPLWLTGISTNSIKDDQVREKLLRFQKEAAKVLWEAFQEGRLTTDTLFDDLLEQNTPEVQAYKMIQGMLQLARSQILLKSQVEDHEKRIELIEAQLGDTGRAVTPDQASQISQGVKAVAIVLGKQTKRNEFGSVYGEMYRKFGVTSYKLLPAQKFEMVMRWLSNWYQELTNGADVPF